MQSKVSGDEDWWRKNATGKGAHVGGFWFMVHPTLGKHVCDPAQVCQAKSSPTLNAEVLTSHSCQFHQKGKKGKKVLDYFPPPPPNYPSAIYYYYLQLTLINRERDNFTHLLPQPGSNFPSGPLSLLPLCPYPSFRPFTYSIHVTRSILSDTRG